MSVFTALGAAIACALAASLPEDATELRAELWRTRLRASDSRRSIVRLERELDLERAERETREREWLEWLRLLDTLELAAVPAPPAFLAARAEAEAAEREERARAARARADGMLLRLRALLLAEQVLDLDVLEVGALHFEAPPREGEETGRAWIGPVVVRLLDDRGRQSGTLAAERLRLECSRTGWGVTLVLEEGRESRGGVTRSFAPPASPAGEDGSGTDPIGGERRAGVRRIHLAGLDPQPWIEAFPELFTPEDRRPLPDDGRWNRLGVRLELNRCLAADPLGKRFRLIDLGGVQGGVLHGVQLIELDERGGLVRRLFADRMHLRRDAKGVELVLENGVQERAGARAPFLEGRYRIWVGGDAGSAWVGALLPGLAQPPERAAAVDGPRQRP